MKIEDALQRFVDNKEKCEIHLITKETFVARITEISEGFICTDYFDSIVNTAYIVRVCPVERKSDKKEISEKKDVYGAIRDFFFTE